MRRCVTGWSMRRGPRSTTKSGMRKSSRARRASTFADDVPADVKVASRAGDQGLTGKFDGGNDAIQQSAFDRGSLPVDDGCSIGQVAGAVARRQKAKAEEAKAKAARGGQEGCGVAHQVAGSRCRPIYQGAESQRRYRQADADCGCGASIRTRRRAASEKITLQEAVKETRGFPGFFLIYINQDRDPIPVEYGAGNPRAPASGAFHAPT